MAVVSTLGFDGSSYILKDATARGLLNGHSVGKNVPADAVFTDTKSTKGSISLSTTWSGNGPYTQTVTISGYTITENSKVDLQPDAAVLSRLITDGVRALYIANDNGELKAYAVGAKPSVAISNVQCTISEVVP